MNNNYNNPHSLTGNEFLDFLSWCEAVGIDFEGKENNNDSQQNNESDDLEDINESQYKMIKTKGRGKYE